MKLLKTLFYAICIASVLFWVHMYNQHEEVNYLTNPGVIDKTAPPCLQMYYSIEKYSKEYGVPRNYAFGIAYAETRYGGPFDWTYDHRRASSAGAVGPMQIIPKYADPYIKGSFTRDDLKNDIDLNVKTSMKMLKRWKQIHGSWDLAFGAYNTGRPCVNDYAKTVLAFNPKY